MNDTLQPDPLDLVVAELRRARKLLTTQQDLLEQTAALAVESTRALDATEETVRHLREEADERPT